MNSNFQFFLKRAAAYLIDIVIVFVIGAVMTCLPIFNKTNEEYQVVYDELTNFLKEHDVFIDRIKDNFNDGIINQEEYDNLISLEKYGQILIDKYDDNEITKDEYLNILKEIDSLYDNDVEIFNYRLKKLAISNTMITLICMFGYFGILQYLLNGQSVGKKILKLRIVSLNGKKVGLFWMIIRSLIVNNIFINLINVSCLWLLNMNTYNQIVSITDIIISIVEALIIYLIITRVDGRGLHDLVAKTKVIIDEKNEKSNKNKTTKVLDGEFVEK